MRRGGRFIWENISEPPPVSASSSSGGSSASQPSSNSDKPRLVIASKYSLIRKIGAGSFGNVYLACDIITNQEVAVKLEHRDSPHSQLSREHEWYQRLHPMIGLPEVLWFGHEGEYLCLVLQLLGPSLDDLFHFCGKRFSLRTTLILADQLIQRIQHLHDKLLVHRDIKPANFLIGDLGDAERKDVVYVIDLGLAKPYSSLQGPNPKHKPYKDNVSITGTARFASLNTHLGVEQTRRDDLESIGYMLVYFLTGELPWQCYKKKKMRNRKDKHLAISALKQQTSITTLCPPDRVPDEFATYITYCRGLAYDQTPDYEYVRDLFRNLSSKLGFSSLSHSTQSLLRKQLSQLSSHITQKYAGAIAAGSLPPTTTPGQSVDKNNNKDDSGDGGGEGEKVREDNNNNKSSHEDGSGRDEGKVQDNSNNSSSLSTTTSSNPANSVVSASGSTSGGVVSSANGGLFDWSNKPGLTGHSLRKVRSKGDDSSSSSDALDDVTSTKSTAKSIGTNPAPTQDLTAGLSAPSPSPTPTPTRPPLSKRSSAILKVGSATDPANKFPRGQLLQPFAKAKVLDSLKDSYSAFGL